jgi:hypothetical protein
MDPPVHPVPWQTPSGGDGRRGLTQFLSSLAVHGNVATSTQNQALSALLFLYRNVLEQELPWLDGIVRWRTIMTSGRSRNSWATGAFRRSTGQGDAAPREVLT